MCKVHQFNMHLASTSTLFAVCLNSRVCYISCLCFSKISICCSTTRDHHKDKVVTVNKCFFIVICEAVDCRKNSNDNKYRHLFGFFEPYIMIKLCNENQQIAHFSY